MLEDIAYVRHVTGKDPAVGVFDLISYSRSRIERGEDPQESVERWLDWAADDALVSLSWHWNAPTDLIDQPGREWWSGFYTRATTFDLAGALADTTSQRFQLLLGDIDAIAAQLHKFQDANVPILWRPLHEAWGEWFWWGARGPEAFVELWRLLYHRLVNVHDLHNLIWVYTHHDAYPHWYPGDAFVDIVSRDIYKDDPSSVFIPEWRATQDDFAGHKLVALSESGTLPDPAVSTDFGVWWSWFSVWNGSRIRSIEPEHLRYVYGHEYVITRDELPVWRTVGLEEYAEVPRSPDPMEVYPNPTSSSATLSLDLPVAGDVRIEVYDQLGRVVLSRHDGWHPPGTLRTQIHGGMAPGVYYVRVLAGSRSFGARLVVAR
jgi:mannan endo-1,4-beta-mannosidase